MSHQRGNPAVDCTGQDFGHRHVLRRAGSMGQTATWYCRDERDGSERILTRQELRRCNVRADRRSLNARAQVP